MATGSPPSMEIDSLETFPLKHNLFRVLYLLHANDCRVPVENFKDSIHTLTNFINQPDQLTLKDILMMNESKQFGDRFPMTTDAVDLLSWFDTNILHVDGVVKQFPQPGSLIVDKYLSLLAQIWAYLLKDEEKTANDMACKVIRDEVKKYPRGMGKQIAVHFEDLGEAPIDKSRELNDLLEKEDVWFKRFNFFGILKNNKDLAVKTFKLCLGERNCRATEALKVPYFLLLHLFLVYRMGHLWQKRVDVITISSVMVYNADWV